MRRALEHLRTRLIQRSGPDRVECLCHLQSLCAGDTTRRTNRARGSQRQGVSLPELVQAAAGNGGPELRLAGPQLISGFPARALRRRLRTQGLAYPGREADYDCNSQVPCGEHNGRQVYYVFGRYPVNPDGNRYPVLDLVLCHGSFLNADNTYVHKNKSFRGFGSYGDILVRDRKMYVAPTPFALAEGTAHRRTLILPEGHEVDADLVEVGTLIRREVDQVVVAYNFDLRTNEIAITHVPNPRAGREHVFKAYRAAGDPMDAVVLRTRSQFLADMGAEAAEDE